MSIGILTLKIGLVATVTGASIATPILLNRGSIVSSVTSQGSGIEGTGSEGTVSESRSNVLGTENSVTRDDDSRGTGSVGSGSRENSNLPRSSNTEEQHRGSQVANSSDQVNRTETVSEAASSGVESNADISQSDLERESGGQSVQRSGDSVSSLSPSTTSLTNQASSPSEVRVEDFNKKCFVIPANSINKDGVELLTCYKDERISQGVEEDEWEEYDSLFHIYDRNKENNPIAIDGSLDWNPEKKQFIARLTKNVNSSPEYSFVATTESYWDRISSNLTHLLEGEECAIYKVTLKDSSNYGKYWLSCGEDNNDDFNSESPTSIPLTDWHKE